MSLANRIDNNSRVSSLKKILKERKIRVLEVHSGISGLIIDDLIVNLPGREKLEFHAMWESSLTDSASKGYPDIEIVSLDSRLDTINQILEVTNKPLIVDGDTGGDFNSFEYMVKRLERAGVSMVIIEDKVFPKRNSLEPGANQKLEKKEIFARKIQRGANVRVNPDFMIVARLESLIAGNSVDEAIDRAKTFLMAGADGIMIHSKESTASEILEFAKRFTKLPTSLIRDKILVCVPTTYNSISDEDLFAQGFNVVIHANHMLRASYKAMEDIATKILANGRSLETESEIATVRQIFEKVGFLKITEEEKEHSEL